MMRLTVAEPVAEGLVFTGKGLVFARILGFRV